MGGVSTQAARCNNASIRRECLNRVIIINERHLKRILSATALAIRPVCSLAIVEPLASPLDPASRTSTLGGLSLPKTPSESFQSDSWLGPNLLPDCSTRLRRSSSQIAVMDSETQMRTLMAQPDVDGALVGGASLEAELFAQIVKSVNKA